QNAKYPHIAARPSQTAPAPPGNPTTDSVWPANVSLRSTMNQPTAAAMIATIVPARIALSMKWNASSLRTSSTRFHVSRTVVPPRSMSVSGMTAPVVQVGVVRRGLGMADDHEPSVGGLEHLDRRPVQPAQRLGRDHVARIARGRTAAREVDDPI